MSWHILFPTQLTVSGSVRVQFCCVPPWAVPCWDCLCSQGLLWPGAGSGLLLYADVFFPDLFLLFMSWLCLCSFWGGCLLCCSSVMSAPTQAGAESSHFTAGHGAASTRDSAHVSSHFHILTNVLLSSACPVPTLPRCLEPWIYSLGLS